MKDHKALRSGRVIPKMDSDDKAIMLVVLGIVLGIIVLVSVIMVRVYYSDRLFNRTTQLTSLYHKQEFIACVQQHYTPDECNQAITGRDNNTSSNAL